MPSRSLTCRSAAAPVAFVRPRFPRSPGCWGNAGGTQTTNCLLLRPHPWNPGRRVSSSSDLLSWVSISTCSPVGLSVLQARVESHVLAVTEQAAVAPVLWIATVLVKGAEEDHGQAKADQDEDNHDSGAPPPPKCVSALSLANSKGSGNYEHEEQAQSPHFGSLSGTEMAACVHSW